MFDQALPFVLVPRQNRKLSVYYGNVDKILFMRFRCATDMLLNTAVMMI